MLLLLLLLDLDLDWCGWGYVLFALYLDRVVFVITIAAIVDVQQL